MNEDIFELFKYPVLLILAVLGWILLFLGQVLPNYFADYTRPLLDKFFSKISSRWRNRSELKKQETEKRIQKLMFDKEDQELTYKSTVRLRLNGIQLSVMGFLVFYIANNLQPVVQDSWLILIAIGLTYITAVFSLLLGLKEWFKAQDEELLLLKVLVREYESKGTELETKLNQMKAETKLVKKELKSLKNETEIQKRVTQELELLKKKTPEKE